MATQEEANRSRRIAALEAASHVYSGEGLNTSNFVILGTAQAFLEWLEK